MVHDEPIRECIKLQTSLAERSEEHDRRLEEQRSELTTAVVEVRRLLESLRDEVKIETTHQNETNTAFLGECKEALHAIRLENEKRISENEKRTAALEESGKTLRVDVNDDRRKLRRIIHSIWFALLGLLGSLAALIFTRGNG